VTIDEKTCKSCGHSCHCYGPDCESCYCDTCQCGKVGKQSMEDIPDSLIKPNT